MKSIKKGSIKRNAKKSIKKSIKKLTSVNKQNKLQLEDNIIHDNKGLILKSILEDKNKISIIKRLNDYFKPIKYSSELLNKLEDGSTRLNKQGRSGAVVLKTKENKIIKLAEFKKGSIEIKPIKKSTIKCLRISNFYNELLLNKIISNIGQFVKISKREANMINKYAFKGLSMGISKNKAFMESDIMLYENNNTGMKFGDLHDIVVNNYKVINQLFLKNEFNIISEFDNLFCNKVLTPFFDTLFILNKKLNLIHSDLKLKNIFVKTELNPSNNIKNLLEYGLILDFIPVISDLDKSNLEINNIKIMANYGKYGLVKAIAIDINNKYTLMALRHKCSNKLTKKKCLKYNNKFYYLDYISFFIGLFVELFRISRENFPKIINKCPIIKKLCCNICMISENDYQNLIQIIFKNKKLIVKDRINIGAISSIINDFCGLK